MGIKELACKDRGLNLALVLEVLVAGPLQSAPHKVADNHDGSVFVGGWDQRCVVQLQKRALPLSSELANLNLCIVQIC